MKTQFALTGFSLDMSLLWDQAQGPKSTDCSKSRLAAADAAMREKFASGKVGFYDLSKFADPSADGGSVETAQRLQRDFQAALILGIGGSYLGAASAVQALGSGDFELTWLSNVDPAAVRHVHQKLGMRKHATIAISKSGNTTETLAGFYHFSAELDPKGYVAITDPKSGELRRLAKENNWTSLEVPPNVGGRFSVLTPVGLLPAALGGVDVVALLEGARQMHALLEDSAVEENPAYLFALSQYLWDVDHGRTAQYLMPYWSSLQLFAQWYVQLWGESLGKITPSGKRVGPTPVAALGTTDQHSLLQLFKEGPHNKLVGFIDVLAQGAPTPVGPASFKPGECAYLSRHSFEKISHEACGATQRSLTNSQVPTYRITVPNLDAAALGALFFFFETATAFAGELYGVNAFDQPGVEESKKLLHAALA